MLQKNKGESLSIKSEKRKKVDPGDHAILVKIRKVMSLCDAVSGNPFPKLASGPPPLSGSLFLQHARHPVSF